MKNLDYAVIKVNGRQYLVSKGDEILVDRLSDQKAEVQVLLKNIDGKLDIGKPYLEKSKIDIKLLEKLVKGEKIDVLKFRSKSRYRRKIGFRPQFSKLQIINIQ